jgi:hypothetical protein
MRCQSTCLAPKIHGLIEGCLGACLRAKSVPAASLCHRANHQAVNGQVTNNRLCSHSALFSSPPSALSRPCHAAGLCHLPIVYAVDGHLHLRSCMRLMTTPRTTVTALGRNITFSCVRERLVSSIEKWATKCISQCPVVHRGSPCYIRCFFNALLGNQTIASAAVSPSASRDAIIKTLSDAFRHPDQGGCPLHQS